jgi:hypothetical protein
MNGVELECRTRGARFRRGVCSGLVLLVATASWGSAGEVEELVTNVALLRATAHEAVVELLSDAPFSGTEAVTVRPGTADKSNWILAEVLTRELTRRGLTVHVVDVPPAPPRVAPDVAGEGNEGDPADSNDAAEDAAETDGSGDLLAHITQEAQEQAALEEAGDATSEGGTSNTPPPTPAPARMRALPDVPIVTAHVLEFRLGQCEVTYVGEGRSFVFGPKRVTRAATVDIGCRLVERESGRVEWIGQGDAVRVDQISSSQLAAYESADYAATLPDGPGAMRYVEPVVVGGIVAGLVYLFYTNQN